MCVLPVAVEDGKEGESVTPRLCEVVDTHARVAGDHSTTPDEQRVTRRDAAVVTAHQHVRYLPHHTGTRRMTPYQWCSQRRTWIHGVSRYRRTIFTAKVTAVLQQAKRIAPSAETIPYCSPAVVPLSER